MSKKMSESERATITELESMIHKLSAHDRERVLWIGQGILFASNTHDGRKEN